MRVTRKQIRKIIKEVTSAPRVVRINDIEKLKSAVAEKIVQMMPADEAASMNDDNLKGLVTSVYDRYFDPDNEGWEPYDDDIEDIRNNLTVVPLPGDEDYEPEEHDRYYRSGTEYDESGPSGISHEFKLD
tara:strand:- start:1400 stop:1789 length:390 start_codon:yes stop_codon:yes gene_type:complete